MMHGHLAQDSAPSWSPDGKTIYIESRRGRDETAPAAIWGIDAQALPTGSTAFAWPAWARTTCIVGTTFCSIV